MGNADSKGQGSDEPMFKDVLPLDIEYMKLALAGKATAVNPIRFDSLSFLRQLRELTDRRPGRRIKNLVPHCLQGTTIGYFVHFEPEPS